MKRFGSLNYVILTLLYLVSGPIQKKSSMSDDSSSEMMELDENALVADPHLEQNLRRLQEEEKLLLEQQAVLEAGNMDDFAALEHQDALRLNQLQQQELQKKQQVQAQRLALRQAQSNNTQAPAQSNNTQAPAHDAAQRREPTMRRRTTCTVRLNNLHAAEAIETDV